MSRDNEHDTPQEPTNAAAEPHDERRRPYRKPRLTELGSVRDLTLAGMGSVGDGQFARRPR